MLTCGTVPFTLAVEPFEKLHLVFGPARDQCPVLSVVGLAKKSGQNWIKAPNRISSLDILT